jgi:hypothetical protein
MEKEKSSMIHNSAEVFSPIGLPRSAGTKCYVFQIDDVFTFLEITLGSALFGLSKVALNKTRPMVGSQNAIGVGTHPKRMEWKYPIESNTCIDVTTHAWTA